MLRAGVIGCGRIGSEFDEDPKRDYVASHSTAYVKNMNTKLVAVCDIDKKKADKCAERCIVDNVYTDYKEMLKKEKLDIISVCTPVNTHPEIVEFAAKYVKGIYCEKPIALTLKQARKMIDVCKKNNVILQINHQRRFDKLYDTVRDCIDIGEIKTVTFYYNRGIYNTGSHMFDLLNWFFGKPIWVSAFGEEPSGIIKYNDIMCNVIYCDVDYPIFEMDIIGTKGRIQLINGGTDINYYKVVQSKQHSENKELKEYVFPYIKLISNSYKKALEHGVEHLILCGEKNKETLSSGEDGYESLLLIQAFLDSAIKKERVYLEEYHE